MNTLGLLQNKDFTLTLQETRSIHDSMSRSKIEFIAYIYNFYYKYLNYENIFNLGI